MAGVAPPLKYFFSKFFGSLSRPSSCIFKSGDTNMSWCGCREGRTLTHDFSPMHPRASSPVHKQRTKKQGDRPPSDCWVSWVKGIICHHLHRHATVVRIPGMNSGGSARNWEGMAAVEKKVGVEPTSTGWEMLAVLNVKHTGIPNIEHASGAEHGKHRKAYTQAHARLRAQNTFAVNIRTPAVPVVNRKYICSPKHGTRLQS